MDKNEGTHPSELGNTGFKKGLGLFSSISIIIGIIIGSGAFYIGAYVLQRTGMSMGLSLLCWVIGALVTLLGALCFAELGAERPVAGGQVVYLNEGIHPVVGYSYGFTSLLISGSGSISALAIAFPTALLSFVHLSNTGIKLIAVALIVLFTIINCFGIKIGAIFQNVTTVAKLVPLVVIIAAALIFGKQTPHFTFTPITGGPATAGSIIRMIAFATISALWAYDGWENLGSVAEEIKNPQKNLPLALIISSFIVGAVYTLFNYAIFKVMPLSKIISTINGGNLYIGTEATKMVFGNVGGILVITTMAIAMLSSLNAMTISFPRMYYAMAQEKHFFKKFGKLHPKYEVPTFSLIVQAVIAILLVLSRNLDQIVNLVMFATLVYNALTILAVMTYRKKYPKMERPFKIFGYPVTVIITLLIYVGLLANTFVEDPMTSIVGMAVPLVGVVVYYFFDRRLKRNGGGAADAL